MTENKNVEAAVVMPKNKNIKEFTSMGGGEYLFQKVAPVAWLDIMDEVEANEENRRRRLYTAVLENIIVKPKMKLEDFTDYAEMDEVITAAIRFQRGK